MSFAAAPSVRRSCRKRMGAPPHPDMNATLPPVGGAEPVLLPPTDLHSLFRRIGALVRRYIYLLRTSGARLAELICWPFLQMLTRDFLQKYLAGTTSPLAQAAGVLIGSVLLWDILFRSKIGFSTTFIEEMWSRNLGNLLTGPLRPYELVAALSFRSAIRLVSMVPVAIAAYFIFGFNLLHLDDVSLSSFLPASWRLQSTLFEAAPTTRGAPHSFIRAGQRVTAARACRISRMKPSPTFWRSTIGLRRRRTG